MVARKRLTIKLRHSRRRATVTEANNSMKTKSHTKLEGQRLLPAAPLLGGELRSVFNYSDAQIIKSTGKNSVSPASENGKSKTRGHSPEFAIQ